MDANDGIIPSNIGLDGSLGGECDGKWYGGVYGWGFTVVVPQTGELANRNLAWWGVRGFGNAMLASGDLRYGKKWGAMLDKINARRRRQSTARRCTHTCMVTRAGMPTARNRICMVRLTCTTGHSMRKDRARVKDNPVVKSINGENPDHPETALRADFERIPASH